MKPDQQMYVVMAKHFMKNLDLENWVLNPGPFLIYQPTTINRKLIMTGLWFFNLSMVTTDTIKYG